MIVFAYPAKTQVLQAALEGAIAGAIGGATHTNVNINSGNKTFVQTSALRYAATTHTGVKGYAAYMQKYNKAYVGTANAAVFVPYEPVPEKGPFEYRKQIAQANAKHYEGLASLMKQVVGCFKGATGDTIHSCVETKVMQ